MIVYHGTTSKFDHTVHLSPLFYISDPYKNHPASHDEGWSKLYEEKQIVMAVVSSFTR